MRFTYQGIEQLPKRIESGIVYHSEEYEVAALLCACGCGHRVSLLVPDSHKVTAQDGLATIKPSIAVCDAPCKSHYFITAGHVEWLPAFTDSMASSVMRGQIARHAMRDENQRSWVRRLWAAIVRMYTKLRSRIGL